ncbi:MAG: hypothetical protein KDK39_04325 [Leptospiraceae bacterium]|nr:hypothetical protein [Leptospiraceae bacterium]
MHSVLDSVKQIGAYSLIGLLVLLMGAYAFVDPNATEATRSFFTTGLGPGSYNGQTISWKVFNSYFGQCRAQEEQIVAQFGDMARNNPMFANYAENCVRRSLKSVYALNTIGEQLHLMVSTESIKQEMARQAQELAASQTVLHADEKLSAQDYYRRLMNQSSFEVRGLEKVAEYSRALLTRPVHVPATIDAERPESSRIRVDLALVRWDNKSMLEELKAAVQLDETAVKKQYEAEQAKLDQDKKQSYQKERPFLVQRMQAEQARAKMAAIKKQLAGLKSNFHLADVERISGIQAIVLRQVSLDQLGALKAAGLTTNLDQSHFYQDLARFKGQPLSGGPYQDGSYTVYARIDAVSIQSQQNRTNPAAESDEPAADLGRELANTMMDATADPGTGLQLQIPGQDQSPADP